VFFCAVGPIRAILETPGKGSGNGGSIFSPSPNGTRSLSPPSLLGEANIQIVRMLRVSGYFGPIEGKSADSRGENWRAARKEQGRLNRRWWVVWRGQ